MPVAAERICMYTPSADGGMARYAQELMTALAQLPAAGRHFELISSQDLQDTFKSDLYRVHCILPALRHRGTYSTRLSWAAGRVDHYVRRERRLLRWLAAQPHVVAVHFQEWTPWLAAGTFRRIRRLGKRIFYTVHNIVPHKYPAFVPPAMMNGWIRRACRLCDGLFVHTETLAAQLAGFLGDPHPPIHVTPHGVWTVPQPATVPATAERLAWKRLLFFGSIRRNKGLHLLLDAAEQLSGYSITIAGEPHEREYFRNEIVPRVRRLRDRGAVVELVDRFIPDDQVGELFSRHSAIVLPYTRDFVAQSGVVFMALAYELPVIASGAGGLGGLFDEYPIGRTFAGDDPRQLAAAVHDLFCDRSREGLIRQIRSAKSRLSWTQAARATAAAYADAPEHKRATEPHDRMAQTIPAH